MPKKKKEPVWMSRSDYAKHRGCSKPYITKLVKIGRITLVDGRIDATKADRILGEATGGSISVARPVKAADIKAIAHLVKAEDLGNMQEEPETLVEAQRRFTILKAKFKQFELEQAQGLWLKKDEVEKQAFDLGRKVRDSLLNIPGRIGPILAAERDQWKVNKLLTEEIERVCELLSSGADHDKK